MSFSNHQIFWGRRKNNVGGVEKWDIRDITNSVAISRILPRNSNVDDQFTCYQ